VRRKFKIYISAISFERKPPKRRATTHATLFCKDTPNRWKGDCRKKRWNIFTPSPIYIAIYIYIRYDVGRYPLTRVGFFLHYPSVCNTYSYCRISLLIVTKSFFLLNIFSIVYHSIRFYATSATEEMYVYKTDKVSIYYLQPHKFNHVPGPVKELY